ncbi:MAG: glutathione S-transferase N-terminal domain-containing protein [Pseudomonadaceae bacterium]|nr:glutathione S-transferase N-terminal domain-containing protein [Pseudomonadaceae bacterium]
MYELHYWPTPNGKKVTILLEELGVPYDVVPCNIGRGDQFQDDFLAFSPNNRMPALLDTQPLDGGSPLGVFESGAIMIYLADKERRFIAPASDARGRNSVVQWVMWQMANQGPKTGERGHFHRLGEEAGDQSYARRRFDDEVNRCYGVLNYALSRSQYVASDDYSIADMICYPWTVGWQQQGQDIDEFPHFKRWFEALSARDAVVRGMAVGSDMGEDYSKLSAEEIERRKALLYNQRARPVRAS